MTQVINKYDIILVNLDPSKWHEQKGFRPCLVVQSNLINNKLWITLVAPLTSNLISWPSTIILKDFKIHWLSEISKILFHQTRVIDHKRIIKKLWEIKNKSLKIKINNIISLVFDTSDEF